MREDIYGGLKNAMERGATLDQAVASFINSGYAADEVREAARALSPGAMYAMNAKTNVSSAQRPPVKPLPSQNPTQTQQKPMPMSFQRPAVTSGGTVSPSFSDRLNQMRQNMQQSKPAQISAPTTSFQRPQAQQMPQTQRPMQPQPQTQMPMQQTMQQNSYEQPKKKVDVLLLILIIILLVSIGFFVASLLFKQQIADFLKSLLS